MTDPASQAAERAARGSYGKLLAILAARSRDVVLAEDALSGALIKALEVWPERGVPANPDAWLLTTARNAILNLHRHQTVRRDAASQILRQYEELAGAERSFPDERLKLLFVCAHPAIDASVRTPLMLQTILGLDAARIGNAFLTAPATMGQRLVRAKTKIREAGLRFEIPESGVLGERLLDVLNAIYAAFGAGWEAEPGELGPVSGLPEEAIYLGRLLADLLPAAPEALGLLSLMLFIHARRDARRSSEDGFIPLSEQDPSLWNRNLIIEAENLLVAASRFGKFGRYQCEAAIQSVHVQRAVTGRLNLEALETLYTLLAAQGATVGGLVALASVIRQRGDPGRALAQLDRMEFEAKLDYQPYWVVRAHCLNDLGETLLARQAAQIALRLTEQKAVRDYLAHSFESLGVS